MLKRNSSSCTNTHPLSFSIDGVSVSVDEMGQWAATVANFESEYMQESFGNDLACAIFHKFSKKVEEKIMKDTWASIRRIWVKNNPPNHAGFYYCHIFGEWVHVDVMELDHIVPGSVAVVDMTQRNWQDKLRPACHVHNYQKGSRIVPSATLEIRPPDEEC